MQTETLSYNQLLNQGLITTIVGFGFVIFFLLLLVFIISLMSKIIVRFSPKVPVVSVDTTVDMDKERAALAIAVAINAKNNANI